jgi:hypothetical protein
MVSMAVPKGYEKYRKRRVRELIERDEAIQRNRKGKPMYV